MAKKKGLNLGLILSGVAVLLGVVAFCMLFAPGASQTAELLGHKETATISNLKLTFGYSEEVLGKKVAIYNFSFMNLLTYLLVLAGMVFAVLAILGKLGNLSKIISAVCFIVAGIFFFCTIAFCAPNIESKDLVSETKKALDLGIGAILGGILSILAGVAVVVPVFLKK